MNGVCSYLWTILPDTLSNSQNDVCQSKNLYFNEIRFRVFFVSLLRLSSTAPLLLIIIHFCIFNHYRNIYASRLHRILKVNVSIYQWIPVLAKYSVVYYSSNNVVTVHLINMIGMTINLHNISQSMTHVGQKEDEYTDCVYGVIKAWQILMIRCSDVIFLFSGWFFLEVLHRVPRGLLQTQAEV